VDSFREHEEAEMAARAKLNTFYAGWAVFLAGFVGLVVNSWVAFGVALAVVVVLQVEAGHIRPVARYR
jgi:hypothetical protein